MDHPQGTVVLKRGRDKPVRNRHPWIFSGAIYKVEGDPQAGDLVDVVASNKDWLATAYYNPHSQIRARILTWEPAQEIDEAWWRARLQAAVDYRDSLRVAETTNAYRLVNAEADRLPGLVVDRYGDYLVLQALTFGIERRKEMLVSLLTQTVVADGIIERSDVDVREKEGLSSAHGILAGKQPADLLRVHENGQIYQVDLFGGQKTGLYLDQRDNRALLGQPRFSEGQSVLNVFSYTGGFALHAIAGGARSVINVDSSAEALEAARANVLQNYGEREQDEYVQGDAFKILREYRDSGRQFDVVILDPPKFAHSQRDVQSAARGYKDLNWLAFRILSPGGFLATFSCSGLVDANLFQKIVFSAVSDAGRDAQIIYTLTQAPDHPVLLTFPESAYLKGLLLHVI